MAAMKYGDIRPGDLLIWPGTFALVLAVNNCIKFFGPHVTFTVHITWFSKRQKISCMSDYIDKEIFEQVYRDGECVSK